MGCAGEPESEGVTAAEAVFSRRIKTVTAALAAVRSLGRNGDPEARRQLTVLAADMERYLAYLKRRFE